MSSSSEYKHREISSAPTVLVFRTGRLGDFLVALPAFRLLRARFPQSKLYLITALSGLVAVRQIAKQYVTETSGPPWIEEFGRDIFDGVLEIDFSEGLVNSFLKVRAFTQAFPSPRVAYLLSYSGEKFLSRFKKTVFLKLSGASPVYSHASEAVRAEVLHALGESRSWVDHQMISALSVATLRGNVNETEIKGSLLARPRSKLNTASDTTSLIVVNVGATHEHKRWPAKKFAEVLQVIAAQFRCRFVFVGLPNDTIATEQTIDNLQVEYQNLTGALSFSQLCELLASATVFLGNDGGTAHLAATLQCPAVTVFSAVHHPGVWEPWASKSLAVRISVPCQYCGSEFYCPKGTQECIQGVPVEEVVDKLRGLLSDHRTEVPAGSGIA